LTDPPAQNVDAIYVKQANVAWPGWTLRKPERLLDFVGSGADVTGTVGAIEFLPEYDWKLHPDGTKACAVVFAAEPAVFDDGAGQFFDPADPNVHFKRVGVGGSLGFASYEQALSGLTNVATIGLRPATIGSQYYIGNGLVEVALNIALTGQNDQDFSFSATASAIRDPTAAGDASKCCTFVAGYTQYDIPKGDTTYVADRGDLCVLDVERYFNEAFDGSASGYSTWSFWSVKNLTKSTELSTWYGGDYGHTLDDQDGSRIYGRPSRVIRADIGTLSFVFAASVIEHRTNTNVTTPVRMEVSHPAAQVVTFNKPAALLFPDGVPQAQRDLLTTYCGLDARADMLAQPVTWTFIANNDLRQWADFPNLREYEANAHGLKTDAVAAPSTAVLNFFDYGMTALDRASARSTLLAMTQTPRFGWFVYADEIIYRIGITPRSTFYVHPNGSWWFYDQHQIYNGYGIPLSGAFDKFVIDWINTGYLEHVIYDHVHLENAKGSLETSFMDLYNAGVAKLDPPTSTEGTFQAVSKASARAVLEKQSIADPVAGSIAQLKMTLGPAVPDFFGVHFPNVWYFFDTSVYDATPSHIPVDFGVDSAGMLELTLGDVWWDNPEFWSYYHTTPPVGTPTGTVWYPSAMNLPFTVASVVMVT
jgi:hypothetical protein